jgi:hypothetical protein
LENKKEQSTAPAESDAQGSQPIWLGHFDGLLWLALNYGMILASP